MGFVTILGRRIEVERIAGTRPGAPTLVLLHEGLGSVAMWRDFPAKLAAATGCPALVYSRYGYGRSEPLAAPHAADYMHREALEALPALRAALGLEDVILVGHSDGASIALVHAGARRWPVRALVVEAPHVFCEDVSIGSIRAAKAAYEEGELRQRLARYHAHVDSAFRGWNDAWLLPEFRQWNIEDYLPGISCPLLAVQGEDDAYGTLAQLDAIERQVAGRFERLVLAQCGHSPHREQEAATLAAMADFIARA
jgi:pimeloyl-ACP methyl ester carboxylesterase